MQKQKNSGKEIGLGAILGSVAMLLFCILSTGQFEQACALVAGDGYELYVPAAVSFFRNLFSGQGITYSWDLSFGMNAIGYYASYGGGSPLHLLFLLYPYVSADVIVLLIMVIKAALIGAAFTWFCKKVWKLEGFLPAIFSIFYVLCGFQVSVNVMNYLWMDAVYLLPFLLACIVDFWEEKKWKGLLFGYAYLFLCHFYMGYMVGFFTAAYFVGYFLLYRCRKLAFLENKVGIESSAAEESAMKKHPEADETKMPKKNQDTDEAGTLENSQEADEVHVLENSQEADEVQILENSQQIDENRVLKKNCHPWYIAFLQYAGIVLLAAGMLAFILVPSAVEIMTKTPPDATGVEILQHNPLRLLAQFLYGIEWKSEIKLPFIYSGIPVLLLLPIFFGSRKIRLQDKLLYGGLWLLMLVSCMFLPFYIFWHGMDIPDGWYHRFAFIISFLSVAMACRSVCMLWEELAQENAEAGIKRRLSRENAEAGIKRRLGRENAEIGTIKGAGPENTETGTQKRTTIKILLYLVGIFVVVSGLGLLFGERIGSDIWMWNGALVLFWSFFYLVSVLWMKKRKGMMLLILTFFVYVEALGNGCREHRIFQAAEERKVWSQEMREAVTTLQADTAFYRIQNENSLMINADTMWGFRGISDFGTLENYKVREALANMGAYTSTRVVTGYGNNPFTQMICNVKYAITASDSQDTAGAALGKYPRCLNLGFMVDGATQKFSFQSENVFENCNALASVMTGEDLEIFTSIPEEMVTVEESGISLEQTDQWFYLQGDPDVKGTMLITYQVPNVGKDTYAMFAAHNEGIKLDRPQFYEYINTRDFGYFGVKYSNQMEALDEYMICPIVMQNGLTRDYVTYKYADFAYANEEALDQFYQIAGSNQLEVDDYRNGWLRGHVAVTESDQILFTTIPYDSGWKVTSAQGAVEMVPLLEGAFLGVRFPKAGSYQLEFSYNAPGSQAGLVITLMSLIMVGLLLIWDRRHIS